MNLRPYQENLVYETAVKLAEGKRKLLVQLPTGAGKTICFSAITNRWLQKQSSSVLILVHRKELLNQTRLTLYNVFGISAQPIVAGMRSIPPSKVYVGMVESAHRRTAQLNNIGLVIIDEAHLANFFKIHDLFPTQFVLGFTATPYSANKKKPLKNYYDDIITTIQIGQLIALGSLCQNITFAPRDVVERASLTVKGGEFDEGAMAIAYSAPKYVNNTVAAYKKHAQGTKAIVFNVSIDHSKQVDAAFKIAGYDSRHLDGTMSSTQRSNILKWFEATPGAILNNVGIATTGTDIPSIETAIMNRATKSAILWLQCTGRASRPTQTKSAFTIIDLGSNAVELGDWSDDRNWNDIFNNPPKARKTEQVAPCKNCPECDAIIAAGARVCKVCGYEYPAKEAALEEELSDFVIVTKGIDVRRVMDENRDKKEYYTFFKIGKDLAASAKQTVPKMDDETAAFILSKYEELAAEWCHSTGKRWNQWHKDRAKEHLYTELASRFKKWQTSVVLPDLTTDPPMVPDASQIQTSQPGRVLAAVPEPKQPNRPSIGQFQNLQKLQMMQMIG
jgi:superfamily II DNA or RNA helicase